MACSVKTCASSKKSNKENVHFHRFPSGHFLTLWKNVLDLDEDWTWTPQKFVCSRHFKPEDYTKTKKLVRLNANAIPTLFLNEPTTSRKRRNNELGESSEKNLSGTSGSTNSSTKRRRACQLVHRFHNYSTSPSKLKKQFHDLQKVQVKTRKQVYAAQRKIKCLGKKVTHLNIVVEALKNKNDDATSHLEKGYEDVPRLLMTRHLKNVNNKSTSREKYPEPLRNFAATLHFYSAKAYQYVRNTFSLGLPHPSVIRKWCNSVECEPGFCDIAFNALKNKVEEAQIANRQVICSLLLDEMAIKREIEFDGKRTWGYIDVGSGIRSDDLEPAIQALVLMVVSHNSHWKLPIGYFLIKSLTAKEKANLVLESLVRLHEVGVQITSVTCDGPSMHLKMLKELGCNFDDIRNTKTWFPHPLEPMKKIYCLLDVCHMLKIIRNTFATLSEFKDSQGNIVSWQFIENLYKVQNTETLKLANKLKKTHLNWERQKMKVSLAAQTLSSSVAEAIDFLNLELKHPSFKGSEATVQFIRLIDGLFDILNSRSPFAKGLKAPMRAANRHIWEPFLNNAMEYLCNCTNLTGRPLWCTANKTSILGFIISTKSAIGVFEDYVDTNILNYLLTYKMSQDHLEIFFCNVRARNGFNNNPTARQFFYSFRRLLLFSKTSERGGNCKVLDNTTVLTVPSQTISQKSPSDFVDLAVARQYQLIMDINEDHDYDILPMNLPLSSLTVNIVTYMSGFVVKMLQKSLKCPNCLDKCVLHRDDAIHLPHYKFVMKKNRGGLIIPSEGVVKCAEITEKFIRRMMAITNNKIPKEPTFLTTFILCIARNLAPQFEMLFPTFGDHFYDVNYNEENHAFLLLKSIVAAYSRIRIFNLCKTYSIEIQGPVVRQQLSKLILFNHQ